MGSLITEPDLSSPIEASYKTTWGEKKELCRIEARYAYERGETQNNNPYIEDTWPHRWWNQAVSELLGDDVNIAACAA